MTASNDAERETNIHVSPTDDYQWYLLFLLPFIGMFLFNIAALAEGAEALEPSEIYRIYQYFLSISLLIAAVFQFKSFLEMRIIPNEPINAAGWQMCEKSHLSEHATFILTHFAWIVILAFLYFLIYTIIYASMNCGQAFAVYNQASSPWFTMQVISDVLINFCAALATLTSLLWLLRLNKRKQSGSKWSSVYYFAVGRTVIAMGLLYVRIVSIEAIELIEKLYHASSEHELPQSEGHESASTVATPAENEKANNETVACPNLSKNYHSYFVRVHPVVSAVLFLVMVESIALIVVLTWDITLHIRNSHQHEASSDHDEDSQMHEDKATYSKRIMVPLHICTLAAILLAIAKVTISIARHGAPIDSYTPMYIKWVLQILQTTLMLSAIWLSSHKIKDAAKETGNTHTSLDIRVLFFSLPMVWTLCFAEFFSGVLPWKGERTYGKEKAHAVVGSIIQIVCYTTQFVGFKRLMSLTDIGLRRHWQLISTVAIAFFYTNFFVLIDIWFDIRYVNSFAITCQKYYPTGLWALVLIISYPGLCFFNFHSVTCVAEIRARCGKRIGLLGFINALTTKLKSTLRKKSQPAAKQETNSSFEEHRL